MLLGLMIPLVSLQRAKILVVLDNTMANHDWTPFSEIIANKVYLGSIFTSWVELRSLGITHIINCCSESAYSYDPSKFKLLWIPMYDALNEELQPAFRKAFPFLDEAYNDPRARVFIHCRAGISRSASVLLAWLMARTGRTYDDCLNALKKKRKCVDPNESFKTQLRHFGYLLMNSRVFDALDAMEVC